MAKRRRGVGRPAGGEDLRTTLLDAALQLLEQFGDPAEVTVAAIVEAANCTPPSLYHYWPKRELLLREASYRGWEAFRSSQFDAVRDDDSALDRIRDRGMAYLAFALERPSLFRVLFLDRRVPGSSEPDPDEPGAALADLVADVTRAMSTDLFSNGDPLTVALTLWGSIHGIAALWAATPTLPHELAWDVARIQQDAVIAGLGTR
jgi:AcrR family transcriptional regulator